MSLLNHSRTQCRTVCIYPFLATITFSNVMLQTEPLIWITACNLRALPNTLFIFSFQTSNPKSLNTSSHLSVGRILLPALNMPRNGQASVKVSVPSSLFLFADWCQPLGISVGDEVFEGTGAHKHISRNEAATKALKKLKGNWNVCLTSVVCLFLHRWVQVDVESYPNNYSQCTTSISCQQLWEVF